MIPKHLQYFVGRPCSIFVEPTSRQLQEKQAIGYFVGYVVSLDDLGVTIKYPDGRQGFFFMRNVLGICEEEILDPNNPEDAKIIEQYKKQVEKVDTKPQAPPPPLQPPKEDLHQTPGRGLPFVEPPAIPEPAKRAKNSIKK